MRRAETVRLLVVLIGVFIAASASISRVALAGPACPPASGAAYSHVIPRGAADGSPKLVVSVARDHSSIEDWLSRSAAILQSTSAECQLGGLMPAFGEVIVNFDPCGEEDGCFQIVLDRIPPGLDADNLLFYGAFSGANHAGATDLVAWCDAGAGVHYRAFCDGASARFCRSPFKDERCR